MKLGQMSCKGIVVPVEQMSANCKPVRSMLSQESDALSQCHSWHRETGLHDHDLRQALVVVFNLSQQLVVLLLNNANLCIMGGMQLFDSFPQGAHLHTTRIILTHTAFHDCVSGMEQAAKRSNKYTAHSGGLDIRLPHALPFLQCLLHSRPQLPPCCVAAHPQLTELPLSAPCSVG